MYSLFPIKLPIADKGIHWNGRPDEFNNIGYNLDFSQEFGLTPFAKTGIYGYINGQPIPHNGNDFAGVRNTPLVAPRDVTVTYVGIENGGYGNFLFCETEEKEWQGKKIKMSYVLAHCDSIIAKVGKKYEQGEQLAYMGTTGLSTGNHTHFGIRPLVGDKWLYKENRGYVDPMPFYITKPIFDKQILYKQQMKLIKLKNETDIYAIDPMGKANLILNWETYQKGLEMGLWEDETEEVSNLPEKGKIIILVNNN